DDFSPPQSDETRAAVAKLKRIVPLGATDLARALETALEAPSGERGRSVIYIGDGMSTANLVKLPELRDLLARFRKAHVPVTSFAVGPRTDLQLLGTIAVHTGGAVFVDALIEDEKSPATEVGKKLAAAAKAAIFYPEEIAVAPEFDKLLPEVIPPVRADRDTILLGKGRISGAGKRSLTG